MGDTVKPEDIEALIELFQDSDWKEFHLRFADIELFLSKDAQSRIPRARPAPGAPEAPPKAERPASPPDGGSVAGVAPEAAAASDVPEHWVAVTAPNLGTFYRAPKPGAKPYVEVGQLVDEETELCLIEVMKLFTALRAGTAGVVKRVCASDGELVEHGQTLFLIEPAQA